MSQYMLEIARGVIPCRKPVRKFGTAENADSGIPTDLWDGANVDLNQPLWLAPTEARIHTIKSDSINDVTGGTGCNSVQIWYLPDWGTKETSEIVTGNVNAGIAMTNPSVIINRMKIIVQPSSTTANDGNVTATAAVDLTISAQINPGYGQTQMTIYGIPSTQKLYIGKIDRDQVDAKTGSISSYVLLVNESPDINTVVFINKGRSGLRNNGTSALPNTFWIPKEYHGPCIVKIQGVSDDANMVLSGGFDAIAISN